MAETPKCHADGRHIFETGANRCRCGAWYLNDTHGLVHRDMLPAAGDIDEASAATHAGFAFAPPASPIAPPLEREAAERTMTPEQLREGLFQARRIIRAAVGFRFAGEVVEFSPIFRSLALRAVDTLEAAALVSPRVEPLSPNGYLLVIRKAYAALQANNVSRAMGLLEGAMPVLEQDAAPRVETEGDAALTQEELQALRFPLAPGHPTKQLAALAKLGWIEEPGNFHDGQRTVFYGPHPCERCGHLIVRVAQDHGGQEFDQPDGPIYPNTTWRWHDCPNRDTPAPHPVRPHTPGSRPPVDPKEGA